MAFVPRANKPPVNLEENLLEQILGAGCEPPTLQFKPLIQAPAPRKKGERVHRSDPLTLKERRWALDMAWPGRKIAVEVQGAVWAVKGAKKCPVCGQMEAGKHGRGQGIEKDAEKLSWLQIHGWRVIIVTPNQVRNGDALRAIRYLLSIRRVARAIHVRQTDPAA